MKGLEYINEKHGALTPPISASDADVDNDNDNNDNDDNNDDNDNCDVDGPTVEAFVDLAKTACKYHSTQCY